MISRLKTSSSRINKMKSRPKSATPGQRGRISDTIGEIGKPASKLQSKEQLIQQIMNGTVMRLMTRFKTIVEKLLPPGTTGNRLYNLGIISSQVIANEGWRSFGHEVKLSARAGIPAIKNGFLRMNRMLRS